ncbi:MAG: type VI secretion system tube protein Hcp [Bacteroidales bacterium]|nr:type VI secretion system tube protein Hcp [Bacteroidales bacterium]
MRIILLTIFFAAHIAYAQVGIGTTNPSPNSVLDLTSPDKGLMLPRVNDTSAVSNPSAGLMIYDLNAQSPAFHNGASWNALAGSSVVSGTTTESITYTFFGPNSFGQGTYDLIAMSYGGSNFGNINNANIQDVSISKLQDINSVNFFKEMISGSMNGGIEFKMYAPGQTSPYYSVKLTNWKVSSVQQSLGVGGEIYESISFTFENIGFKDWINNSGFTFNLVTKVIGPY